MTDVHDLTMQSEFIMLYPFYLLLLLRLGELVPIFAGDGCKPVSTLLGVTRLFEPEIMVELEATAVA